MSISSLTDKLTWLRTAPKSEDTCCRRSCRRRPWTNFAEWNRATRFQSRRQARICTNLQEVAVSVRMCSTESEQIFRSLGDEPKSRSLSRPVEKAAKIFIEQIASRNDLRLWINVYKVSKKMWNGKY